MNNVIYPQEFFTYPATLQECEPSLAERLFGKKSLNDSIEELLVEFVRGTDATVVDLNRAEDYADLIILTVENHDE